MISFESRNTPLMLMHALAEDTNETSAAPESPAEEAPAPESAPPIEEEPKKEEAEETPATEPVAEPVAEPASEPVAEPAAEPAAEPVSEPLAEPAAEPVSEPLAEPAAEPTADPVAEPAPAEDEKPAPAASAEPEETTPVKERAEKKEKPAASAKSSSPKKARVGDKPSKDDKVQEKATIPIRLEGTFKTIKGREITGPELSQSLERQYNAPCGARREDPAKTTGSESLDGTTTIGKKVPPEELQEIFDRLFTSGQRDRHAPEPKLEIVQAKYDEHGREVLSPIKTVTYEEQTAYMCELYSRCIETKKKAEEKLAEKYLKPLGRPKN
jgi:hypothetical protein